MGLRENRREMRWRGRRVERKDGTGRQKRSEARLQDRVRRRVLERL